MTSVFGDLDLDEIPDDPYFIENGTYKWRVLSCEYKTANPTEKDKENYPGYYELSGDDKKTSIIFNLVVNDPTSKFHGRKQPIYLPVFPRINQALLEELSPEEHGRITDSLSRVKQTLRGFGLSETEIRQFNQETGPDLTVGRLCTAEFNSNEKDGKNYKNVRNIKPLDEDEDNDDPFGDLTTGDDF